MIRGEIFDEPGHDAQMGQPKLIVVLKRLAYGLAVFTEYLAAREAKESEEVFLEFDGVGGDYGK